MANSYGTRIQLVSTPALPGVPGETGPEGPPGADGKQGRGIVKINGFDKGLDFEMSDDSKESVELPQIIDMQNQVDEAKQSAESAKDSAGKANESANSAKESSDKSIEIWENLEEIAGGSMIPATSTTTGGVKLSGKNLGELAGTASLPKIVGVEQLVLNNDVRLSDKRDPKPHTHNVSDVSNLKTELDKIPVNTNAINKLKNQLKDYSIVVSDAEPNANVDKNTITLVLES